MYYMVKGKLAGALLVLGLILAWAAPAPAQPEAKQISAHLANETIPLTSHATTVGGFLEELSISLPPDALVDPPLDAALKDGMGVFLRGITVSRGEVKRQVPAELQLSESWHYGPEMMLVADVGTPGEMVATCTVFFWQGKEVGRRQYTRTIKRMKPRRVVCLHSLTAEDGPSVEQILAYRSAPGSFASPPRRYSRIVRMESTAYEPGPLSCGKFASGNTSCGYEAGYGVVAVDPDIIPLHTRLYIEGYGYAVAGDVGSAIKGNRVDVGMMTIDECYDWGRREVDVYILN